MDGRILISSDIDFFCTVCAGLLLVCCGPLFCSGPALVGLLFTSADGAPLSGFGKARARRFQAVDAADSPISEWGRTFSLSWRQKCTVQKAAEREDEIASLHFNFKLKCTSSNKQATNASIDHTSVRSQNNLLCSLENHIKTSQSQVLSLSTIPA